jgi:hypothetical protein
LLSRAASRGQTLLETLLAIAALSIALGAVTVAVSLTATHERPFETRSIALDAASNAATELVAATAYDPVALARVRAATWQVRPPAPPSPAPALDARPLELRVTFDSSGQGRVAHLEVTSADGSHSDALFDLRFAAPPPGALLALPSAPPR